MSVANVARQSIQAAKDLLDPEAAKLRKAVEERAKFLAAQRSVDLKFLMGDARGRRFVFALLESCGFNGSTLQAGIPSGVLEGRRTVAIDLSRELASIDPDAWILMLRESMNARPA